MRAALVLAVLLLPPAALAAGATVSVTNFAFTPATVTLGLGESVTWSWAGGTHSVVEDGSNALWCSVRTSGTCARPFAAGGRFAYHCGVHPSMRGTVRVVDPQAADLAVDAIAVAPDGSAVDVVVRNAGASASPASAVAVSYRSAAERAVGTGAVPPLATGASTTVTVPWAGVKVGDLTVIALADPTDLLVEPSESDNRREATASVLAPGVPGVVVPP